MRSNCAEMRVTRNTLFSPTLQSTLHLLRCVWVGLKLSMTLRALLLAADPGPPPRLRKPGAPRLTRRVPLMLLVPSPTDPTSNTGAGAGNPMPSQVRFPVGSAADVVASYTQFLPNQWPSSFGRDQRTTSRLPPTHTTLLHCPRLRGSLRRRGFCRRKTRRLEGCAISSLTTVREWLRRRLAPGLRDPLAIPTLKWTRPSCTVDVARPSKPESEPCSWSPLSTSMATPVSANGLYPICDLSNTSFTFCA